MKFKIVSMLIVLAMLSVMPMIYMGKFDPAAWFDKNLAGVGDVGAQLKKMGKTIPGLQDGPVTLYRWRDAHGIVQYGSQPPPAAVDVQAVAVDQNRNVVDAVEVPAELSGGRIQRPSSTPNPYSVKGMKKVLEDAQGIEEMLQQRHRQQQKAIGRL